MDDADGRWAEGLLARIQDYGDLMEERDLLVDRLHGHEDRIWELQERAYAGDPSPWDAYARDLRRLAALCQAMAAFEPSFGESEA